MYTEKNGGRVTRSQAPVQGVQGTLEYPQYSVGGRILYTDLSAFTKHLFLTHTNIWQLTAILQFTATVCLSQQLCSGSILRTDSQPFSGSWRQSFFLLLGLYAYISLSYLHLLALKNQTKPDTLTVRFGITSL